MLRATWRRSLIHWSPFSDQFVVRRPKGRGAAVNLETRSRQTTLLHWATGQSFVLTSAFPTWEKLGKTTSKTVVPCLLPSIACWKARGQSSSLLVSLESQPQDLGVGVPGKPSDCLRVWAWYAPTALPPQFKELSPSPAPPQKTQLQHQFEVRTETRPPNRLGFSRPWTASFGCMSSRWSAQTSGPQGDEGIATQGA